MEEKKIYIYSTYIKEPHRFDSTIKLYTTSITIPFENS